MTITRRLATPLAVAAVLGAACGQAVPASPPVEQPTWSRHALDPGPTLTGIVAGGPGLIGVGADETGGGVWASADGMSWTPLFPPDRDTRLADIATGDGRFVAVGARLGGESQALVLASADGVTWEQVDGGEALETAPERENIELTSVAFNGGTWVAAGVEYGSGGQSGGLWTSSDGTSWRRPATPDPGSRLADVGASGPGFVAVGEAAVPAGQFASTILTSPDGTTWTALGATAPFETSLVTTVAGTDGLAVIGGTRLDPRTGAATPAFWTSPDGSGWTPAVVDDPLSATGGVDGEPDFFEGGVVRFVAHTRDGWVAVGNGVDHWVDTVALDLAVWTSPDGRAWRRAPHALTHEAGFGSGLEYGPLALLDWNGTLLVSGTTEASRSTVWISPPRPGGVEPAPRPTPAVAPSRGPGGGIDATPAPDAP